MRKKSQHRRTSRLDKNKLPGVDRKRSASGNLFLLVQSLKELFGQRLREQRIKHGLTLEQLAEKSELSSNYIGMVERGLKEPGLATIVKLLNALNISADTLLCDLVPSASHVTDDEIRKRLEGLTPIQKKAALDLLDTYISNLPYLTNEE